MSDAQGPKNDGDAAEQPDGTAPLSDDAPAPEQVPDNAPTEAPTAAASDTDITRGGPDPDTAVFRAEGTSELGDETAPNGSTGAASAPGSADPVRTDARGDDTPDAGSGSEEPDYEALAAELDRLESDPTIAAPVAPGASEPAAEDKAADPWFEPATSETFSASEPQPALDEPNATPDAASTAASAPTPAPGPIFVQAPEPPRKRGNRGAAGLIGLVAAVAFAVLYAAANYLWQIYLSWASNGAVLDPIDFTTEVLLQPPFWFTVVAFWLSFWFLGVFVNRARWWSWVVLGIIVALLTYVGVIAGQFLAAPFWNLTADEGLTLLGNTLFAPMALVAFMLAREVTIWFGSWVSRRGARVAKLNDEEREEYDKVMAEGPKAQ